MKAITQSQTTIRLQESTPRDFPPPPLLLSPIYPNTQQISTCKPPPSFRLHPNPQLTLPNNPSHTANGTRQTLLHCMNTGFEATAPRTTAANTTVLLASADSDPTSYIGPSPPAESPPHGHRYVQLLFQQPTGFNVPVSRAAAVSGRLEFDLQNFVSAAGLGMPVVADFFVVVGAQSQVASASATASRGIAKNSLLPFEGAAAGRSGLLGGGWAAMVAGALGLAALQVESWLLKLLEGWRCENLLALRPSRFPSLRCTFCTSAFIKALLSL